MLADEVNQNESLPESESGEQNLSEAGESGEEMVSQVRVTELESLVTQKDEELTEAGARISGLEQAVADKDSDIAALKQAQDELEGKLSATSETLTEAVASYRALAIQTNPEVMEELVSGDTIEAIEESLKKARSLIDKVKQGLESEISLAKVPAGAPERRSPDLSALSPREKIQYAIGGKR